MGIISQRSMTSTPEYNKNNTFFENKGMPRFESKMDVNLRMFIAGGISGAVSKTCTAPFGRLTILYQVQGITKTEMSSSWIIAMKHVIQNEGLRSLWKGNMATILHRLPYSAINFSVYESMQSSLQQILPKEKDVISGKTDLMRRLVAGASAGSISTIAAYPLDLVRTRLSVQRNFKYYSGINHAIYKIIVDEGFLGLYKGLGGTLLHVTPNLAINLCAYETLRSYWIGKDLKNTSPGFFGSIMCGGVSGMISSTITFPLDLVRRRMQLEGQKGLNRNYTSYIDAFVKIWKQGRIRALYAGIIPEYIKVTPSVAIIYSTYEFCKSILNVDHYNHGRR